MPANGGAGTMPAMLNRTLPHPPRRTATRPPARRRPIPWQRLLRELALALPFAIALWTVHALFNPAHAGAVCWTELEAARTADNLSAAEPRVAPMRAVARRLDAIVRAHPALQSLQETRMRSRWQVLNALGGTRAAPARGLWYQARNHRPSMWQGACGVHPSADRLPPTASVVIQVNRLGDLFNGPAEFRDEVLEAWKEPQAKGEVQGHPVWHGWMVVLTTTGRPPWTYVSNAELMDFAAREYDRQQAANGPNAWLAGQRAALARHRAAMDAASLAAPARAVFAWQHPDVPPERYPLLVKADPAFPWNRRDPQQVQVVAISIQGAPPHEAAMREVLHSFDYASVEALMRQP